LYAIAGATGQLGRLVINQLLKIGLPSQIVAAVRNPAKPQELALRGVIVREADYSKPGTLTTAFAGIEKLLLISSTEVCGRLSLHRA
jgi:NAD(P)H dehydrogenase (quinone)